MINNPTPRYYRIYRLLQQAIQNLEYGPDGALPSEHALAEKFDVSRLTIRKSLDLLQQEGLIYKQQGVGTFVTPKHVHKEPIRADINTLMNAVSLMGTHTQVKLLKMEYETPNPFIKNMLQLTSSELVQKSTRVRFYKGRPFSHLTAYVPEKLGRLYTEKELANSSLHSLFLKNGIEIQAADQTLTAILADPEKADALHLEISAALLCIKRLAYDKDQRPVEYLEAAYNPKQYEYRMKLRLDNEHNGGEWSITDENKNDL